MNRKHVTVWVLFDFANSVYPAVIQTVVFNVYYASVIVGDKTGLGDWWWSRAVSLSVLFVAVTSPLLGAIADRSGVRKRLMLGYTAVCVGAVALFTTIQPGMIVWGFILAVVANIGFEGSIVFYNAYLPDIAPPEHQGFVSGLGFGIGYIGSIAGLLVALLFVPGRMHMVWLSVAAFFAIFSVPTFLFLPPDRKGVPVAEAAAWGLRSFRKIVGEVWGVRPLRRFLLAYFFYIDGILTVIVMAGLFAQKTFGFTQRELILLFMVVQVSALVGALALARPTDRWGAKRVLTMVLVLWVGVSVSAYFITGKTTFFVMAVVAGFGLGSAQAASRSLMAGLIPKGKEAEMFGFYAFCGKSSSILGPLVFGSIAAATGGDQRLAVVAIGAFFLVGLVLLQRVRAPAPLPAAGAGSA